MVDNSGSSKAQMPSLSQEGGLGAGIPQGVSAGVKLEAVMEQLQRQQQARLEMERKERHLREARIMYSQQVAAQQAILAAARASGAPLGAGFLGKALGAAAAGGGGPLARATNQSSVDSEREDEEDRGRDSEEEEDEGEERMMMEGEEGSEEDEEGGGGGGVGGGGLEYLRKQTLALQQGVARLPHRPFPPFSSASSGPAPPRAPSPPVRVKQEPKEEEENRSPAGHPSSSSPNGQADWSYDESFKQNGNASWTDEADGGRGRGEASRDFAKLYELDHDPNRKEFLDDLFTYMQKRGTPVNRIPIMAKQVLDLYMLYKLVTEKGGLVEVINKKIWREITKGLNLPTSITSAAFTLRTQYMKYLYPYECERMGLSSPGELQAAIDSNRREGRRPSYSASLFRFSPSPGAAPHILSPPKMPLSSLGTGVTGGHNGLRASPGPSLKKAAEESTPSRLHGRLPSRLPMALALGHQQVAGLARAATLEQLREKLETGVGDGPERKMARLAEEQQRLMQQAFHQNLLAMASHVPTNLRLNSSREDKQDLALTISTSGATSISVSVEVNGILYSGMLYAQKSGPPATVAATISASATVPPAGPSGGFGILSSAHSPSPPSSSSKGPSSAEPSTSSSP
ncbi:AT-rich interactive domain-containing protein 3B-like [Anguilla anguilla]|uniref:AT-rich interactive domain-containing protein 3B-like n=1 Tax=Anguilla anguilla TaxID=7936 RepID=UPI0015AB476D|nr:AT-rich interactive domain-containing protein 3B-like [Anguilla anguilla]